MAIKYIGVGEFTTSKTPGDIIKTLALGSCVAVVLLDPKQRAVGMLHVALPDSSINKKRRQERPGMFADTGVPVLMREMIKLGYDYTDANVEFEFEIDDRFVKEDDGKIKIFGILKNIFVDGQKESTITVNDTEIKPGIVMVIDG